MVLARRFAGLVVLVPGRKRIRLNRKTPAHLAGYMSSFLLLRYGRGCVMWGILVFPFLITTGGVVIRIVGCSNPAQVRTGVG